MRRLVLSLLVLAACDGEFQLPRAEPGGKHTDAPPAHDTGETGETGQAPLRPRPPADR